MASGARLSSDVNRRILSTAAVVGICGMLLLGTAGCSGFGNILSPSVNDSISHISGTVAASVAASGGGQKLSKTWRAAQVAKSEVNAMAESGCTIEAHDLSTNAVVAKAKSDSDGNYTLTGVTVGTTYKVTAQCASYNYAVVATAIATKLDDMANVERVATNPRSTVIAAYVVKALLDAIDEATASLPVVTQKQVVLTIMRSLDSVIQTIAATIEAAISSGTMAEPSPGQASVVATGLKSAMTSIAVGNAIAAGPAAPAAVDQAVSGAKNASVALQACDSGLSGTEASCLRAVAKLMYTSLGFSIGLRISGGSFQPASCAVDAAIAGGGTLGDYFPNAQFQDQSVNSSIPSGYCVITPKVKPVNRNRGYQNDDSDKEPVFVESGDIDGDSQDDVGALTALAHAFFTHQKFNLGSLDKFVFGATGGAGFNARLIRKTHTVVAGMGRDSYAYYSSGSWVNDGWVNTCEPNGYGVESGGQSPCNWSALGVSFSTNLWNSANTRTSLAEAIGAGDVTGLGVFMKKYGGKIPVQADLDATIDLGRQHIDYNISGEKEMMVAAAGYPDMSSVTNPCYDNDPTTPCVDSSGAPVLGLRVNLSFGTLDATTKTRPISVIEASVNGAYYLRPYFGPSGFSGVIGFVKVSDGLILRDELQRDRGVKLILSGGSECDNNATPDEAHHYLPVAGADTCATGKMFNVDLDWSSCSENAVCPNYRLAFPSVVIDSSALILRSQNSYKVVSEKFCAIDGSDCKWHPLLAKGAVGQLLPIKFSKAANSSGNDTYLYKGTGKAMTSNEFNAALTLDPNCHDAFCTLDHVYFVDNGGLPQIDIDADISIMIRGVANIGVYKVDQVSADLAAIAKTVSLAQTPIRNINFNCEAEPYFIDGNGDGRLNCETVNGMSQATQSSGDLSFSSLDEYKRYVNNPAVSAAERVRREALRLNSRDNAFEVANPAGMKKLMAMAFNGWFDGTHELTSTTALDALQSFALVYMFMTSGGETKHIEGLGPTGSSAEYQVVAPLFSSAAQSGSGPDVKRFNDALGKAFSQFAK